jgi:hypothetical protein
LDSTATLTWFTGNYGSIMQAFALQNEINDLGYNNQIINYIPDKFEKLSFFCTSSARMITLKAKIENRKIALSFLSQNEVKEKEKKFDEFNMHYLNLTDRISRQRDMSQLTGKYNVFLCGSDQIWNPSYFKACNFLNFVPEDIKKIAYAPSVGASVLQGYERNRMQPLLQRFRHISVREESSKKLIESMVEEPVQVVCDPVFLLSKDTWEQKLNLCRTNEKYILCYFLGDNPQYSISVKLLEKSLGLKVKVIPTNSFGYKMGFETLKTVGPKEWINLIYGAELVLTDSFHATAFSIIFNKNFFVMKRFSDNSKRSQNSRIYHILDKTGLQGRIWDNNAIEKINYDIKNVVWNEVNCRIAEYRDESEAWLKNALKNDMT